MGANEQGGVCARKQDEKWETVVYRNHKGRGRRSRIWFEERDKREEEEEEEEARSGSAHQAGQTTCQIVTPSRMVVVKMLYLPKKNGQPNKGVQREFGKRNKAKGGAMEQTGRGEGGKGDGVTSPMETSREHQQKKGERVNLRPFADPVHGRKQGRVAWDEREYEKRDDERG